MPREEDVFRHIEEQRLLPVLTVASLPEARARTARLRAHGLRVLEFTLRTPAGLDAIRSLRREPELLLGVGTVTTLEEADAALHAGARFLVSPGLDPALVEWAEEQGVPLLPGVATPSEAQRALALGLRHVKLFPAALLGLDWLRALAAVFPGLRFCPTGGLGPELLPAWLAEPSVFAAGASWPGREDTPLPPLPPPSSA